MLILRIQKMLTIKNLISKEGSQNNTSELTPFPLLPLPIQKKIMLALEEKVFPFMKFVGSVIAEIPQLVKVQSVAFISR